MFVTIVSRTFSADDLCAMAAAVCTNSYNLEKAFRHALASGHESIMEHASFTFLVEGVSRVLLAQLTRHRIASFSVESQRYVSYQNGFSYVVPPSIRNLGEEAVEEYNQQMAQMHRWYESWQQKLGNAGEKSNEDARFVLPGACTTRILFTMNARELRHFFRLRTCNRAQWEIRQLADEMLKQCKRVAPIIFADAGCACMAGKPCPEGKMSCGEPRGGELA